jgi:hypothetical protein
MSINFYTQQSHTHCFTINTYLGVMQGTKLPP